MLACMHAFWANLCDPGVFCVLLLLLLCLAALHYLMLDLVVLYTLVNATVCWQHWWVDSYCIMQKHSSKPYRNNLSSCQ